MAGRVEQEGHLPGALDFGGKQALVFGAGAGDAARDDLAALRDIVTQNVGPLVVKGQILVRAEAAELAPRGKFFLKAIYATSPAASASLTVRNLNTPSLMRMLRSSSATAAAGARYSRRT